MEVIKRKQEEDIQNIYLKQNDTVLSFYFGGNGDLYWTISDLKNKEEYTHKKFLITAENYGVYRLFEKLYMDIKHIKIFDQEEDCEKYKKYNISNYKELFNEENQTITWYSDETAHEVANYVTIKKHDDCFQIDFYTQPYIEGYDNESNQLGIGIRFRNSGSSYAPFNIIFMRMFDELQKVDDINDVGHQFHIEEYLYNKKNKSLKKIRK